MDSDRQPRELSGPDNEPPLSTERRPVLQAISIVPFALPGALPTSLPDRRNDGSNGASKDETPSGREIESGDIIPFTRAVRFGEDYEFSVEVADGEFVTTAAGRVVGADQLIRTDYPGGTTVTYLVDGTVYVVEGDDCRKYDNVESANSRHGGEERTPPGIADIKLEVKSVTTKGDRSVLVLEPREWPNELPEAAKTNARGHGVERRIDRPVLTYHVDAETRRLRRIETPEATVKYRSWGDVAPIEAPARECRPVNGTGG